MTAYYANRTVSEGELVLLNAGEYDGAYIAGVFRAKKDLDMDELAGRYVASIKVGLTEFDPPDLPPVAFGVDPRTSDPVERGFIAWLGEQGFVERLPSVAVNLSGAFDTTGAPRLVARVEEAPHLQDLEESAAPRP